VTRCRTASRNTHALAPFGKGVEEWRRFARPQSAIGLTRAICS
jgi:hypothetical protein